MPVYNEASGLATWIRAIEKVLSAHRTYFVISDDGSTDGLRQALSQELNLPCYVIIGDGINRGPGAAFNIGFAYILEHGNPGDAVLTLESDGTADLTSLQPMLEALKTKDVVLASVYMPGGGFTQTQWMRLLLSNMANSLTRKILHLPYRTLTSFYRGYRFEALLNLKMAFSNLIDERGFICQVELLYKCNKAGLSIAEIPTKVFSDRRKSPSKMKIMRTIREHLRFVFKTRFRT